MLTLIIFNLRTLNVTCERWKITVFPFMVRNLGGSCRLLSFDFHLAFSDRSLKLSSIERNTLEVWNDPAAELWNGLDFS